jgi:hypothetical protein
MRPGTVLSEWRGVARSRRVKTRYWLAPAITNETACIGSGYAYRVRFVVSRLIMTDRISWAVGRILERSWWGIVSADTRPSVPAGVKP